MKKKRCVDSDIEFIYTIEQSSNVPITMGVFVIYGVIILTFVNWSDGFFLSELPCEFEDSVNITGGTRLSDGLIWHNGIVYSKQNYEKVHYRLTSNGNRVKVDAHVRGCPCMVKTCLRLCCPLGSFVNINELKLGKIQQKIPCYSHDAAKNFQREVFDQNSNQSHIQNLDKYFSYAEMLKATKFYKEKYFNITNVMLILIQFFMLMKIPTGITLLIRFTLQDGHINIPNLKQSLGHRDYCLRAVFNQSTNTTELGVFVFYDNTEELPTKYIISAICK